MTSPDPHEAAPQGAASHEATPSRAAAPAGPAATPGGAIGPDARARLHALDAALRVSRARYYAGDATPDPALEAAVCAAAHALRAAGWPVLAVLGAVKAHLEAPGGPPGGVVPHPVAEAAVRWCIAHYFDGPGAPPAPARGA